MSPAVKFTYLGVPWALLLVGIALLAGCGGGGGESGAPEKLLRLDPENPRYVRYGTRPTVLITSGEVYGAVLNEAFDYDAYLDALADDGFNLTRVFNASYWELPSSLEGLGADSPLAPAEGDLITPWQRDADGRFDLRAWNPAYFTRLRDFLAAARKRGIVVELTLFSTLYDRQRWNISPFNPANNVQSAGPGEMTRLYTLDNRGGLALQEAMVRKVVTELNDYGNVYFEVINEPWVPPTVASDEWQDRIIGTIRRTERSLPSRHLIARNYDQNRGPGPDVNPAVAIHNFHYRENLREFSARLDGVLSFDETGLQGREPTPYRVEAWTFLLDGGGIYDNLDFSYTVDHEDGSFEFPPETPGGGGEELREQLGVLDDFLSQFDLRPMEPRPDMVAAAPEGTSTRVLAGGGSVALYAVGDGALRLRLPRGDYRAEWVDPLTGETLRDERIEASAGETELSPPPHELDVAVALEREEGG